MIFLKNVVNIFTNPAAVMKDISESDKPKMLMPLLYSFIISMIVTFLQNPITQEMQQNMNDLFISKYGTSIPNIEKSMTTSFDIKTILIGAAGFLAVWLFSSFVLWVLCKIFKGKITYKKVLSVKAHTYMIVTTGALISIAIQLLLKLHVSPFSMANLFPSGKFDNFLYDLLYNIDLFGIWEAVVVAIGLYIINDFAKIKSYIAVFTIYILKIFFGAYSLVSIFLFGQMLKK